MARRTHKRTNCGSLCQIHMFDTRDADSAVERLSYGAAMNDRTKRKRGGCGTSSQCAFNVVPDVMHSGKLTSKGLSQRGQ